MRRDEPANNAQFSSFLPGETAQLNVLGNEEMTKQRTTPENRQRTSVKPSGGTRRVTKESIPDQSDHTLLMVICYVLVFL
ncbi:hypothetical protein RRG08_030924 [Elysia crispata]|uniref:Uncharacterized protein n=1 Tax=Elysia crispata TaxID=231223 RepID=A0AAE1AA58_9GAST|nr:hypothetical protein RRG08_030924 [Elysia crispata]